MSKLFQITERLMINQQTGKIYDMEGNHVGSIDLENGKLNYRDDASEEVKGDFGRLLMALDKVEEEE